MHKFSVDGWDLEGPCGSAVYHRHLIFSPFIPPHPKQLSWLKLHGGCLPLEHQSQSKPLSCYFQTAAFERRFGRDIRNESRAI